MLFKFLTYLQPIHYFQRYINNGNSIFPVSSELPIALKKQFVVDENYSSKIAQAYDLSWQAIQKGYIGNAETYKNFDKVPLVDEYRFIRKYFNAAWVIYVLVLRLMSFKNPIKEISAFYVTRGVKRSRYLEPPISHEDWKSFSSVLVESQPRISVVIPTLNRYVYLKDVLKDLEKQDYTNFEVIIVDQSEPYRPEFYKDFDLVINLIRQEERALWLARNRAIKEAQGKLIAFSEDDVRVQPDWLAAHLRCLDFFNAQVSAGVFYPEGQNIPKERSFFSLASQFATGNAMLYKSVFEQVGLFDRQFERQRMGDGEFGLRVYLAGIRSVSNPFASCIDVKAGTGGLREMGSWDAFRTKKWFAPRPIPSVLYLYRKYFGNKAAKLALLRTVPLSIMPYRFKKNKPMLLLGVLLSILLLPVVGVQVWRSWRLASRKLREGARIDNF